MCSASGTPSRARARAPPAAARCFSPPCLAVRQLTILCDGRLFGQAQCRKDNLRRDEWQFASRRVGHAGCATRARREGVACSPRPPPHRPRAPCHPFRARRLARGHGGALWRQPAPCCALRGRVAAPCAARAPAQRSAAPLRGLFPSVPACYPQDAHTIALGLPGAADVSFFAVYDGHGGALVSSLASQQVRSLPHTFCSRGFCLSKGGAVPPVLVAHRRGP